MADIYTTGLITVTGGSTAATGNGTGWALADVLRGDLLLLDGVAEPAIVASVTDDTHLTLLKPWAGTTASDAGYAILPTSWLRTSSGYAADIAERWLAALESSTIAYYGPTPDPDIGEDGQLWLDPESSPWRIWKRVAGAWVEQAAPGGAPATADYLVKTASTGLSAERVVTDTGTVTWDWATAGQAKANVVLPGAVEGRLARWGAAGALGQTTGLFEAADGNVGLGTSAPGCRADISLNSVTPPAPHLGAANTILRLAGADSAIAALNIDAFASLPTIIARRANGTAAVPTALNNGDVIFNFRGHGHTGSGYVSQSAGFGFIATENWSPTGKGAAITFATTTNGSTATSTERARVHHDGSFGIGTAAPTALLHVNGPARIGSYTVATLPDAATVGAGTLAWVTDGSTTTRLGAVTGGGSTKVLVGSDGASWLAL